MASRPSQEILAELFILAQRLPDEVLSIRGWISKLQSLEVQYRSALRREERAKKNAKT